MSSHRGKIDATCNSLFKKRTADVVSYGDQLAVRSKYFKALHVGDQGGEIHLMRYHWINPLVKPVYRIGIFGGIHGDEQSGVIALIQLLHLLENDPETAQFYELFIYPICNPWGFDNGCRETATGRDLNRCFWQKPNQPDALIFEHELRAKRFDGIIALHTDDTSHGIYGYVNGSTLTRFLLEPALNAAASVLPRDERPEIDTHPAEQSIITGGYTGILAAPPDQHPKPFEIVFETPHNAHLSLQVEAHLTVMKEILQRFREINSSGMDI